MFNEKIIKQGVLGVSHAFLINLNEIFKPIKQRLLKYNKIWCKHGAIKPAVLRPRQKIRILKALRQVLGL